MRIWAFILANLILILGAAFCRAQGLNLGGLGGSRSTAEPVTARAAVSGDPLVPGKSAEIAVELTVAKDYHAQSAFAPEPYIPAYLTIKSADGLSFGTPQAQKGTDIPAPPELGGTLNVYEGKSYFLVPITVDPDAKPGSRTLELSLTTQACIGKNCFPPKTIKLSIKARIGEPADFAEPVDAALFDAAHKMTYAPMPVQVPVATQTKPAVAVVTGPGNEVALMSSAQQVEEIQRRPFKPFNAQEQQHSLGEILLFALLGGLILNFMPCVLPVIPLKALSFVQHAHGNHRIAMLHSLAFSAGIIALFMSLAIALRTFGLFYGQQFQSPAFLITMTLFVVALALSMLNVWTINPPQAVYQLDAKIAEISGANTLDYASPKPNVRAYFGSFGNGLMATLLATPCSGPFLGPVFAWAFVQPAWLTLLALALVGVGMSLPYIFLAAFPKLLNKIPRAGRWSELLKQGLGIFMLGVGVYLITRIPNTRLWFWALLATLLIALVCWGWGQIPSLDMTRRRFWTIRAVVVGIGLVLATGLYFFAVKASRPADSRWVPFNVGLLDQALKEGRPVVVDWTADWCINCHALDVAVLSREDTLRAFSESNALLLRADLTVDNPPATELNRKLGSEAIPVLAIFSPARPDQPVVLRDSYSRERVIKEVTAAR